MTKKCNNCRLVNYGDAAKCIRCESELVEISSDRRSAGSSFVRRAVICVAVCIAVVLGFYFSLIITSKSLSLEQKLTVQAGIGVLENKGFANEASLLRSLAVYRATDSWFNSMIPKENAFAATNYPFGIVTLYSDFFAYPIDDVERAAILLHEARHLSGGDEKDAYEFVWKHREQLGWTKEKYYNSTVWKNVRAQTRDYSPSLFICGQTELNDCTE